MINPSKKFIFDTPMKTVRSGTFVKADLIKDMARFVFCDLSEMEYMLIGMEYEEMFQQIIDLHEKTSSEASD